MLKTKNQSNSRTAICYYQLLYPRELSQFSFMENQALITMEQEQLM